jgi:hypothetical protein
MKKFQSRFRNVFFRGTALIYCLVSKKITNLTSGQHEPIWPKVLPLTFAAKPQTAFQKSSGFFTSLLI